MPELLPSLCVSVAATCIVISVTLSTKREE